MKIVEEAGIKVLFPESDKDLVRLAGMAGRGKVDTGRPPTWVSMDKRPPKKQKK